MRTNTRAATKRFVPGSSRGKANVSTLRRMLRDATHRAEVSARIAELREARHMTQPAVAERVGVTLRAYQKWEAGGGPSWDNLKRLAEAFDVEPEEILQGPTSPTQNGNVSQLDQIATTQAEVLARLAALEDQVGQLNELLRGDEFEQALGADQQPPRERRQRARSDAASDRRGA